MWKNRTAVQILMYSSPSFSSSQLMVRCVSCLLPSTYTVFFFRFYLWLCWLFLAVWAFLFLSCRAGATLVAVLGLLIAGFSCCEARAVALTGFSAGVTWALSLQLPGSRAQAWYLWYPGLVAARPVGSCWIRDRTARVSCIGRWILYHRATREALSCILLKQILGSLSFQP